MRGVGLYVDRAHERKLQEMGAFSEVVRLAVRWALLREVEYPPYERAPEARRRSASLPSELYDRVPEPRMQYVSSAVADLVSRAIKGEAHVLPQAPSDVGPVPVKTTSSSMAPVSEEVPEVSDPEPVENPSGEDPEPIMSCFAPAPPGGVPGRFGKLSQRIVASAVWLSGHLEYEPVVGVSPKLVEKHRKEKAAAQARIGRVSAAAEWRLVNGRWAWMMNRRCPDCDGQILTRGRIGPGEPAKAWCRSCRRVLVEVE
jgi:hypothetical protein